MFRQINNVHLHNNVKNKRKYKNEYKDGFCHTINRQSTFLSKANLYEFCLVLHIVSLSLVCQTNCICEINRDKINQSATNYKTNIQSVLHRERKFFEAEIQ